MFGKKSKQKAAHSLTLCDQSGAALQTLPLQALQLPEAAVLELSVLYFNDPEPCHIHRAAVHKRAMMELMERCPLGERVPLDGLTALQRRYFSDPAVAFVRITEDAP